MRENTPRYFEWDYDNGIVREYERSGECNGCGQCCVAQIHYRFITSALSDEHSQLGSAAAPEGIWYEVNQEGQRRLMQPITITERSREHACPHLGEGMRCDIHHLKNWKRDAMGLCDAFPLNPAQIMPFSECSYTFRLLREGSFEGVKG